ncbi:54S ribosomal protein L44 [Drechslerella dactyloides]|uniref:Large ribosomal subunit protein mL53 n=1 Tax=Drechslerella dactyloides TaxID=74499 RepID=A0AAD6IXN5_DREDA|nr:54S ribosomal protein L44 [Drechslerella dactyloides]
MLTKFLTNVAVSFNPFSKLSKSTRLFLSLLPPDARQTIKIQTKVLPRTSEDAPKIAVTFKDGKLMELEPGKLSIKDLVEEVDRHSRMLRKKEELGGN